MVIYVLEKMLRLLQQDRGKEEGEDGTEVPKNEVSVKFSSYVVAYD